MLLSRRCATDLSTEIAATFSAISHAGGGERGFKRVVERKLAFREPEFLTASVGLPHVFGEFDQHFDDLGGLDHTVVDGR